MRAILILLAGLLFGSGLAISGMVNPMRVLNFFDIFGIWDPTLLCVMAAALVVTFIGYRLVLSRPQPLYDTRFHLPEKTAIDAPLVIGSAMFGLGWGLTGFCPAPAVASLVYGYADSLIFVTAMLVGMLAYKLLMRPA